MTSRLTQREADLRVLMSVYSRSTGNEAATKLHRIQNSLTAGGYLTVTQFDDAISTLRSLKMVELKVIGDEKQVMLTDYGAEWLMTNFHWEQGDRATLVPKSGAWMMTPPERNQTSGIKEN